MTTPKKGWFEKNQGLITFLGYLATVIISGSSMYYSNSKSREGLKLAKNQFHYEISKDSINRIQDAKRDLESAKKFKHQDSLNKHQDSINQQQLGYFKSQTNTAKSQLNYFKKQTDISETQLKNADLIYQQQINDNKPAFIIQEFTLDSAIQKPLISIRSNIYNSGKRAADVKKITAFLWNPVYMFLDVPVIPFAGETVISGGHNGVVIGISDKLTFNKNTIILYQIFYEDKAVKGIQVFRLFVRFNQFKPMETAQIDEKAQQAVLDRIRLAEKADNKIYLNL